MVGVGQGADAMADLIDPGCISWLVWVEKRGQNTKAASQYVSSVLCSSEHFHLPWDGGFLRKYSTAHKGSRFAFFFF